MFKDPIVEEVRQARDKIAARYGYDLKKLIQGIQEKQRLENRPVVSTPPRRISRKT